MNEKKISSVGEFAFLDTIRKNFSGAEKSQNVAVGIGDDCFCFKSGKETICVTKDMLVEDVHFKKEWISPESLGKKAIEVNISDIASMGKVYPKYVFIGLGLPADTPMNYINRMYGGFKQACNKYGAVIAGGDTVKSDKIIISVTVVGTGLEKAVKRSGAKNGDLIGVTNTFGDSGAGVAILYKYGAKHKFTKDEKYLISRQNNPEARLKEAHKISKYLTSMTDASDGLFISLKLLAKESKKGADIFIEDIPMSRQLKRVCGTGVIPKGLCSGSAVCSKSDLKADSGKIRIGRSHLAPAARHVRLIRRTAAGMTAKDVAFDFALCGAEDFELVFTVPPSEAKFLKKMVPDISYIGKINNSKKVRYFYNGKEQKTVYDGYKHF